MAGQARPSGVCVDSFEIKYRLCFLKDINVNELKAVLCHLVDAQTDIPVLVQHKSSNILWSVLSLHVSYLVL